VNVSQLAINSVSTRHASMEEALSAYAEAGFQNVEFVIPQLKGWMRDGRTVADLRALLDRHGLRCVGGFECGVECFSDPKSRAANHDLVLANAELLHQLGGGVLVVGTDGPQQPSLQALDAVAEVFAGLAGRMEGLNVSVAIEFNWSPLIKSLRSAQLVAAKVNHPQVGVLFDTAHYYVTPSKMEQLTPEAVALIKHVHINDMADKPGELSNCNSDRVLPGQGVLDLPAILARLEDGGYRGYYSIELFNEELWQLPAAETARRCYQSLLPYCKDAGDQK